MTDHRKLTDDEMASIDMGPRDPDAWQWLDEPRGPGPIPWVLACVVCGVVAVAWWL